MSAFGNTGAGLRPLSDLPRACCDLGLTLFRRRSLLEPFGYCPTKVVTLIAGSAAMKTPPVTGTAGLAARSSVAEVT